MEDKNMKTKFITFGLIFFIVGQISLAFAQPTFVEPAFEVPISKLPLKAFDSKNDHFTAIVCPDDKNTFVFKVNWRGNIGMREKLPMWSIEACFKEVWISNDGQYLIGSNYAEGALPSNYTKEEIIFSFFENGRSIRDIKLSEIISDFSKLQKTQPGLRWGDVKGFNEAGYLVAETVENQIVMLDPTTGRKVKLGQRGEGVPSNLEIYRDLMNCFEFAYPKDYEMSRKDYEMDWTLLRKKGAGWVIEINLEDLPTEEYNPQKMTFEDFAMQRSRLMFSADGPDSSQYATDVIKRNNFTTPNNLKALEFYLTVVRESWPFYEDGQEEESDIEVEKSQEGPVYAVLLSKPGYPYKVLLLKLTDKGKQSQEEKKTLRYITDTIKILKF